MSLLPTDTPRTLWKNSLSQVLGRVLLSLARFVAAAIIVRYAGSECFGAYSLILNFLFLFEFLTEFGQADIGVRNICQQPEREGAILRALVRLQAVQGLALALLLPLLIDVLNYDASLVRAAAVGSIGVLCYAGLQIFRVSFKVRMTMERDVLAELAGVATMLPLTWYVCAQGGGLELLVGCYAVSRIVFFGVALGLGYSRLPPLRGPAGAGETLRLLRQAVPLGLSGLSVAVYDGLPPVMLSKLADMHAVALLAGVCRYFFPVLVVVQAITTVFYPMLSRYWRVSETRFSQMQQIALEAALLIGAGLACGIFAGAGFLMRLIGPSLAEGAGLLQLMACVVVARTITAAMSPLIIVAGRQIATLWLGVIAIGLQVMALLFFIPRFGAVGVAIAYLLIETVVGVVPVCWIGQYVSGARLRWATPIKIVGCAIAAAGVCEFLPYAGTFWSGASAGVLYLALTLATGAFSPQRLLRVSRPMIDPVVVVEPQEPSRA